MRLRIAVHDFAGHPFQAQLAEALTHEADVLHLYCASLPGPKGRVGPGRARSGDSLRSVGVRLPSPIRKESLWSRWWTERPYGQAVLVEIARFRPDVVISANATLSTQSRIQAFCAENRIAYVHWLQDIVSLAMRDLPVGLPRPLRSAAATWLGWTEGRVLRAADAIVAISQDFLPFLRAQGVPAERITVIENWAPLDELPVEPRDNGWARSAGLPATTRFVYAGTLGLKHRPSLLLALAAAVPSATLVVISQGAGAEWLRAEAHRRALRNVLVFDFVAYAHLPQALCAADVLIVLLDPGASAISVPSKVLSYLCAGRALLAAVPATNLASRVIERAGCGVVVDPDDPAAFIDAARHLAADDLRRAELGRHARRYAEETFDIAAIARHFRAVMDEALRRRQ